MDLSKKQRHNLKECELTEEQLQDCINIQVGLFHPLTGFMGSKDYYSVLNEMTLESGDAWTIPITFDVQQNLFESLKNEDVVQLKFNTEVVGTLTVFEKFIVDSVRDSIKIFKTNSPVHPGVRMEIGRHKYRLSGEINVTNQSFLNNALSPQKTKAIFKSRGWNTIVGFQTRNPVHRAHEHLQRVGLEICDGLFINPLTGWKKQGDFSEEAVLAGYNAMLKHYYCGLNVYLDTLKTPMRYAGPREAIFHAIIRRNLGCTHFIIGRDHAGVGDYYGKYEAQELARSMLKKHKLGIELLLLSEPYYCHKCAQVVSEKHCAHDESCIEKISGTKIRAMLELNERPSKIMMREEVSDAIIELNEQKFIR